VITVEEKKGGQVIVQDRPRPSMRPQAPASPSSFPRLVPRALVHQSRTMPNATSAIRTSGGSAS